MPSELALSALANARADVPLTLDDGGTPARRRAAIVDQALGELAGEVLPPGSAVAVVAVGGYGRGELSPRSDLDLLILAGGEEPAKERLRSLLYPLWDAGFQVGHAVRTPTEAIEYVGKDLDAATALLTARLIAGDAEVFRALVALRGRWLETGARALVQRILERTAERHARGQPAGWALAPDLKQDIGGLRDLHTIVWLEAVAGGQGPRDRPGADRAELFAAGETLLVVREALHGLTGRATDRVRIDLQPPLAAKLGLDGRGGADALMAAVHVRARTIEYRAALETRRLAERVLGGPRRSGRVIHLGHGLRVADGVLVGGSADTDEMTLAMRLIAAHARTGRPIAPRLNTWLARCFDREPAERWGPPILEEFLGMLRARHARGALELLDHVGGWTVLLPEWAGVRGLAQYDHHHTFTVDGHLFAAVTRIGQILADHPVARAAAEEAGNLDNLYLAALLHDAGKGSGEDHSVAGERLARSACARLGLPAPAVEEVAWLVRHHLLLAVTATQRDLDDPAVVRMVAERAGSQRRLRLLYVLSLADAAATGPGAWSDWKDALVRELYWKALRALDPERAVGGADHAAEVARRALEVAAAAPELTADAEWLLRGFPPSYLRSASVADTAAELTLVREALAGRGAVPGGATGPDAADPEAAGQVAAGQPAAGGDATGGGADASGPAGSGRDAAGQDRGLRYRLDADPSRGQPVLTVCAPERRGTLATVAGVLTLHRISVLRAQLYRATYGLELIRLVVEPPPARPWEAMTADLDAAAEGRVAVEARLERKVRGYQQGAFPAPDVRVLPEESAGFTVVEVRARDALGLLYAITAALTDLGLDIHVAKIDTLGEAVTDVFYVRTPAGLKLSPDHAGEVQLAVSHRCARLLSGDRANSAG